MPPLTLLLLLALIFTQLALAADKSPTQPAASPPEIKDIFDITLDPVPANDPKSKSNCIKWKAKLLQAWTEAYGVLEKSVEALNELGMGEPPKGDKEAVREYLRKAQVYEATFGEDIPTARKNGNLKTIKENFDQVIQAHKPKGKPEFYARCGDEFLEYLGPKAPDPLRPGKTLGSKTIGQYGYWHAVNMPEERAFVALTKGESKRTKHPICTPGKRGKFFKVDGVLAMGYHHMGLLILCPELLDVEEKYTGAESSVDVVLKKVKEGTSAETLFPTIARTWVHEMFHYVLDFEDARAVNSHGGLVPNKKNRSHNVYGWESTTLLAKFRPKDTLKSPENYAWFSVAMYASEWFWADGTARKEPLDEKHKATKPGSKSPAQDDPQEGPSGTQHDSDSDDGKDPFRDPSGNDRDSHSSGSGKRAERQLELEAWNREMAFAGIFVDGM